MEQIFHPKYRHLITVFSLKADNNVTDIDEAIIHALIKAKKSNFQSMTRMCLEWNRVDVARKFIFTDDNKNMNMSLNSLMDYAIIKNRVAFVELFLETGYSIKNYLTYSRLLHLYNEIPISSDLYMLLRDQAHKGLTTGQLAKTDAEQRLIFSFYNIGRVTQKLLRDLYVHRFTEPPFTLIDHRKAMNSIRNQQKVTSRLIFILIIIKKKNYTK